MAAGVEVGSIRLCIRLRSFDLDAVLAIREALPAGGAVCRLATGLPPVQDAGPAYLLPGHLAVRRAWTRIGSALLRALLNPVSWWATH